MAIPMYPATEVSTEHVRCMMKAALGKYLLIQFKSDRFYPDSYARRMAAVIQNKANHRHTNFVTKARQKEEAANRSGNPNEQMQLREEIDALLLENVDMRDWLRIMKSEWRKLQVNFPRNQQMILSYIQELIGIRNEQSHERPQPLYRFVDTCAFLLEAIKAEEAAEMREIANQLGGGYPVNGSGNISSLSTNGHHQPVPKSVSLAPPQFPILEAPDGETERVNALPPNGDYFIVLTGPSGQTAQFPIPRDKTRIVIGRGASSDLNINDNRVSRAHAQMVYNPDAGFTITDLYSANGTLLNKKPLPRNIPVMWAEGEIVTVGDTTLILRRGFG